MQIHESAENYLETILILSKRNPNVRAIDIAAELGFSKPSVSIALKKLRENGYVLVNEDSGISLTEIGKTIAEQTLEKHEYLSTWLISIGVTPEIAREDACRIEHVMSTESFDKLKEFVKEHN